MRRLARSLLFAAFVAGVCISSRPAAAAPFPFHRACGYFVGIQYPTRARPAFEVFERNYGQARKEARKLEAELPPPSRIADLNPHVFIRPVAC